MAIYDEDAPNALLTEGQRERLYTDKEDLAMTDQARWRMDSRIRERLAYTIYDFALIYQNWDELNLDKLFDGGEVDNHFLQRGAASMIATLYRGLFEGAVAFEPQLKKGISRAESEMNDRPVRVTFTIEPQTWETTIIGDIAECVNPDDVNDLTVAEMRDLLEVLAYCETDITELAVEGATEKSNEKFG